MQSQSGGPSNTVAADAAAAAGGLAAAADAAQQEPFAAEPLGLPSAQTPAEAAAAAVFGSNTFAEHQALLFEATRRTVLITRGSALGQLQQCMQAALASATDADVVPDAGDVPLSGMVQQLPLVVQNYQQLVDSKRLAPKQALKHLNRMREFFLCE